MTQETVTRVVAAVVAEASKEKRGERDMWGLKLKVPFSDYPIPTSMPLAWEADVFKGESYMVKLRRGRLVKDDSDGTRDFHYFWDVEEWNTRAPATVAESDNGDDRFRTKEELRWTEAMHIAVRCRGVVPVPDGLLERTTIVEWALWFYETLSYPPVADPPEEDLPFEEVDTVPVAQAKAPRNGTRAKSCPAHKKAFDRDGRHPTFDKQGNVVGSCQRE